MPTKLKLLRGNPGKRAINHAEPEPEPGVPDCPAHLSQVAKEEWARITVELMEVGLITKCDRAELAAYCQTWARWVEAERRIADSDEWVQVTPKGYPMMNPYLCVANKAMELMHKFLTQFGLTPSSRTRLHVTTKSKADDLEAFLNADQV